jgi:hypothetical protein
MMNIVSMIYRSITEESSGTRSVWKRKKDNINSRDYQEQFVGRTRKKKFKRIEDEFILFCDDGKEYFFKSVLSKNCVLVKY